MTLKEPPAGAEGACGAPTCDSEVAAGGAGHAEASRWGRDRKRPERMCDQEGGVGRGGKRGGGEGQDE